MAYLIAIDQGTTSTRATREQFTVASSLVFGLAVSSLGYLATTLLDDKVVRVTCLQFASVLLLTASVGAGIFIVINRLRDFRGTTRMVKLREKGEDPNEVARLETWTDNLGVWSRRPFWTQVWTFFFGVAAFAVHLVGAICPTCNKERDQVRKLGKADQ